MESGNPIIAGGTVWILGAGFSQGLGAPTFRELFRSERRVKASGLVIPEAPTILQLYRRFASDDADGGFESLWRDPEEFIEVLESAREPGRARDLLKEVTGLAPDVLVDSARRLLALECSQFLRGANPETERWQPYRTWVSYFDGKHTVVTFNYDRALERLKEVISTEANHYSVIVPSRVHNRPVPGNPTVDRIGEARMLSCAPVLKLHGSVDWVTNDMGEVSVDSGDDLPSRVSGGRKILLAVPGPEKGTFDSKAGEVRDLWTEAVNAVMAAARVVFLGYRFPVTDTRARIKLLNALKFAGKSGRLKTVEIVLGPDKRNPHVARMEGLLSFALQGSGVVPKVLPLYVQDYLYFAHE